MCSQAELRNWNWITSQAGEYWHNNTLLPTELKVHAYRLPQDTNSALWPCLHKGRSKPSSSVHADVTRAMLISLSPQRSRICLRSRSTCVPHHWGMAYQANWRICIPLSTNLSELTIQFYHLIWQQKKLTSRSEVHLLWLFMHVRPRSLSSLTYKCTQEHGQTAKYK